MSASPFGFGPSPEELARALAQLQAGMPAGFSGTPSAGLPPQAGAPMAVRPFGFGGSPMPFTAPPGDLAVPQADNEADVRRLEQAMGMVPQGGAPAPAPASRPPLSFGAPQRAAAPAGSMTVPLPPQRPAELQTAQADIPAQGAQPIMAQGVGAPGGGEPSMFDRLAAGLGRPDVSDLLINIGSGLMTQRGFGPAIAVGVQANQAQEGRRAATDLARAEYGLKVRKLGQEAGGLNQTRSWLIGRGVDASTVDGAIAAAQAGRAEALSNLVSNASPKQPDAPSGYRLNADGSASYIRGGPQDPTMREAEAAATARGTASAKSPDDFNLSPGQVRYDGSTGRPIAQAAPGAPEVREFEAPDGTKRPHVYDRATGGWRPLDIGAGASAGGNPYATGKFNEGQGKAAGFSDRMLGSEQTLRDLETTNSGFLGGMGGALSDYTPNTLKGADRQRFEQAKKDFVNAQLRRESGAAISQKEFDNAAAQYFPQPGDSPDVIAQKRVNRQRSVEAMAREGGPSYRPHSIFDESGALVPYQPRQSMTPAQPSRAAMEAEARRRGLIR